MMQMVKPRPQDDEAIAQICRWLCQNSLIATVTRTGKIKIIPTEDLEGYRQSKTARRLVQSHFVHPIDRLDQK
jgi:hypothetical protein